MTESDYYENTGIWMRWKNTIFMFFIYLFLGAVIYELPLIVDTVRNPSTEGYIGPTIQAIKDYFNNSGGGGPSIGPGPSETNFDSESNTNEPVAGPSNTHSSTDKGKGISVDKFSKIVSDSAIDNFMYTPQPDHKPQENPVNHMNRIWDNFNKVTLPWNKPTISTNIPSDFSLPDNNDWKNFSGPSSPTETEDTSSSVDTIKPYSEAVKRHPNNSDTINPKTIYPKNTEFIYKNA